MGREIRRVPPDWTHPTSVQRGRFGPEEAPMPLYDESYREACESWLAGLLAWEDGTHKDIDYKDETCRYYWDYAGRSPKQEYYRPDWPEALRTAYQVYETVSEGTPVSPVFATVDELRAWLISEWELSDKAAQSFIAAAWAPSMIYTPRDGVVEAEKVHEVFARDKEERDGQS